MNQYNFSSLNDKELEELSRDLLSLELNISFQSFKVGKDKGIDLRYSTNSNENSIIVQVKHYLRSGYNQLLRTLDQKEKPKILALDPERYILVTSLGLSPTDKEKLKKILEPYIQNTNDIYGCDDLNRLLIKYSEIEKKHFKLWFSNINIIQKIINNGINGRSAFIEGKIKKNLSLYVTTKSFIEANEIIDKHKVLLITGIPGIGKTTLANLITYKLLAQDYRLIYVDEKIREAEDLFDNEINSKQLFFFDDFLGSSYLEIINSRNTEKSIVDFIERIRSTKNKCLILTTRSTILNQARSKYEKLSRANLNSMKFEIKIGSYSNFDKARILYNHLYFNDLEDDYIEYVFKDKNYWNIIKHINYNPRLIEYFTNKSNISHLKPNEYLTFIMDNLDNPEEIWSSAFTNQLNNEEKLLLLTLLSFGRSTNKYTLDVAFEERIANEILKHGFTRNINIFNISIKNLLDGYISNSYNSSYSKESYIDFINPSLKDYLITFLNKNNSEKWRLIDSFIYIEQFLTIFRPRKEAKNNVIIENNEVIDFLKLANSKSLLSIYSNKNNYLNLRIILLNTNYLRFDKDFYIENHILAKLIEINWVEFERMWFYDIIPILNSIPVESKITGYVKKNWDKIVNKIVDIIESDYEMDQLVGIFNRYDIVFSDYRSEDENWFESMHSAVDRIFEIEAEKLVENGQQEIYTRKDFEKLQENVLDRYFDLTNQYLGRTDVESSYDPFSQLDADHLIFENQEALKESDSDDVEWDNKAFNLDDSISKVDNLFSQFER